MSLLHGVEAWTGARAEQRFELSQALEHQGCDADMDGRMF